MKLAMFHFSCFFFFVFFFFQSYLALFSPRFVKGKLVDMLLVNLLVNCVRITFCHELAAAFGCGTQDQDSYW